MPAPHTAKAIVFTCIDERLESSVTALLESFKGGAFHAAMAGGGQVFTIEPDQTVAIKQIMAAYTINHVNEIYLQSHLNCGAYKLAGVEFASPEAEIERLYADLDTAAGKVGKALAEVGAPLQKVVIHTDVVTVEGKPVARPEFSRL